MRTFELDELAARPGTYVNPETGVVLIVDDSADVDSEVFEEAGGWVAVSDELPVDEPRRDELIQHFQATYHPGESRRVDSDEDDFEEDPKLEPDEDPDEL